MPLNRDLIDAARELPRDDGDELDRAAARLVARLAEVGDARARHTLANLINTSLDYVLCEGEFSKYRDAVEADAGGKSPAPYKVGSLFPCNFMAGVSFDEADEPRYLLVDYDVYRITKTTGKARPFREGWQTRWLVQTIRPGLETGRDPAA
jgi:hypothetical protein